MLVNSAQDQVVCEAKALLTVIKRNGYKEFSHYKLYEKVRGQNRFKQSRSLDRGLSHLVDRGYLKELQQEKSKQPGRPESTKYAVNPYIE